MTCLGILLVAVSAAGELFFDPVDEQTVFEPFEPALYWYRYHPSRGDLVLRPEDSEELLSVFATCERQEGDGQCQVHAYVLRDRLNLPERAFAICRTWDHPYPELYPDGDRRVCAVYLPLIRAPVWLPGLRRRLPPNAELVERPTCEEFQPVLAPYFSERLLVAEQTCHLNFDGGASQEILQPLGAQLNTSVQFDPMGNVRAEVVSVVFFPLNVSELYAEEILKYDLVVFVGTRRDFVSANQVWIKPAPTDGSTR